MTVLNSKDQEVELAGLGIERDLGTFAWILTSAAYRKRRQKEKP